MTASGPLLVDDRGSPVWYLPVRSGTSVADFKTQRYQGQPVLTWWQGTVRSPGFGQGAHVLMDAAYRQIGTVQAGNSYQADLHDFQLTPQGTALLTAFHAVPDNLSALGGPGNGQLLDCILQEVDLLSGAVIFEWHARNHIDPAESQVGVPSKAGQLYDYFHLNSVDVGPDGNLLISARNTWAVYKLDRKSGSVLWRLGGKRSDFAVAANLRFAFQHDARWLDPGTITLFDDGAGPPNVATRSRGLRLAIDEGAKTIRLVSEFLHLPNVLATSQGNIEALDNGNFFIGWGSQPYFSEHSPAGDQVYTAKMATNQSYRAFRFPWSGHPGSTPAVAARRAGAMIDVYASWNGSTDVARWDVQAGSSAGALATIGAAARSGFETRISVKTNASYVAARAFDGAGNVLASSPSVKV